MFTKFAAICSNTFTEVIRQPIYGVLLLVGTMALVLDPAVSAFTMEDDNKLLQDLGLSTLFVVGLMLAGFGATGVISQEIENQTVLTVVSKPVGRPVFILGKYVGVAGALGIAYYLLSLVFFMTIRHRVMQTASDVYDLPVIIFGCTALGAALLVAGVGNYVYGWQFGSAAVWLSLPLMTIATVLICLINRKWAFQPIGTDLNPQLWAAILLVFLAVLVLAAVAVAASTRLGQVMTMAVCSGTFVLGLISSYVFGRFKDEYVVANVAYRVVPELTFFWISDALTQAHPVSLAHVGWVCLYAGVYVVAILAVGVALFQRREVG
jgi:ABC-2 type transport system permease protein